MVTFAGMTGRVRPESTKYTRNGRVPEARDASPESESVNQFCIGHLRERVRAPDPEAPRGAVVRDRSVGDAAKVSDRQLRRYGLQAVEIAVVEAKWRARRAAPSALTSASASRANTWGGVHGGGRTRWARATRQAAAVGRQWPRPVAGLDCMVRHHRHPFESPNSEMIEHARQGSQARPDAADPAVRTSDGSAAGQASFGIHIVDYDHTQFVDSSNPVSVVTR